MRDLLEGKLWYKVLTSAPEGAQATPKASLEMLARLLPHGSGYDGNWGVEFTRRGLSLTTEWHSMNENGFYDGWYPVTITLHRDGKGCLDLKNVRVNQGGSRYGLAEMIAEDIVMVLEKVN